MPDIAANPIELLRPGRKIVGHSAVLLPFLSNHEPDWQSFEAHVERTIVAGLIPAVNMDTGYINLLDDAERMEVLRRTERVASGQRYVAGAYLADQPGAAFDLDTYARRIAEIQQHAGVPVIFQSWGLTEQSDQDIIGSYQQLSARCNEFLGFELSTAFLPFGKIYSLEVYRELMGIKNCRGAKHSSLRRDVEWQRLALRDEVRPDFMVLTGNDLAIDMVMYGSDYLLGLSSFCPDLFGRRDQMWADRDPQFYQLNDVLQYLGFFGFRAPVPAYKHTCAQFLHLRGMIDTNLTHVGAAKRPDSDLPTLSDMLRQIDELTN